MPQVERPAMSRAEIVELNREGKVLREELSFGGDLCLEKDQSSVYGGRGPPV